MKYLNFHTHQNLETANEQAIYNVAIADIAELEQPPNNWVSVGIHPWHIDAQRHESQLRLVEKYSQDTRVLAIGECGLDRQTALPVAQQLVIFEAHVQLAEQLKKPVLVHCIRAFDELLAWKKRTKTSVPLVVHGFNSNLQIGQQLIKHGFWFSLGAALLRPQSNATSLLKTMPIEKFFLENDNHGIAIEAIYEATAQHVELTVDALKRQIWRNFEAVVNF